MAAISVKKTSALSKLEDFLFSLFCNYTYESFYEELNEEVTHMYYFILVHYLIGG